MPHALTPFLVHKHLPELRGQLFNFLGLILVTLGNCRHFAFKVCVCGACARDSCGQVQGQGEGEGLGEGLGVRERGTYTRLKFFQQSCVTDLCGRYGVCDRIMRSLYHGQLRPHHP
jgi:hypothetical protein